MLEEQLKALLKKVKGDTSLQEKFKAAASPDAAVEIAKGAGFAITAITTFFFAITIIGPHTTVQAQPKPTGQCHRGITSYNCKHDTEAEAPVVVCKEKSGNRIRVRCWEGNCAHFYEWVNRTKERASWRCDAY